MKISVIVQQLRAKCPTFAGRVAAAARYKMIDENTVLAVPHAFVIPMETDAGEPMSQNSVAQKLTETISVVVALDNHADERGQAAISDAVDEMRSELWAALLGWQPDGLGAESLYRGMTYGGDNLLGLDRARLWYQYDFVAERWIDQSDGHQVTELSQLPHFDGFRVSVDVIDPMADPNLHYPGPDGRIETEVTIPPTGNLP